MTAGGVPVYDEELFDPARFMFQDVDEDGNVVQVQARGRPRAQAPAAPAQKTRAEQYNTKYLRVLAPRFRVQLYEAVISKVTIPGRGGEAKDNEVDDANMSDDEMRTRLAGLTLNVKVIFRKMHTEGHEAELAAHERFVNGWRASAVKHYVDHYPRLFKDKEPLYRTSERAKSRMTPEEIEADEREGAVSRAEDIYNEKSSFLFQDQTSGCWSARLRVNVPRSVGGNGREQRGVNNRMTPVTSLWRIDETEGDSETATTSPGGAELLRRGSSAIFVIESGSMWVKGDGEFGHHLQASQILVTPRAAGDLADAAPMVVLPGRKIVVARPEAAPAAAAAAAADDEQSGKRARRAFMDDDADDV